MKHFAPSQSPSPKPEQPARERSGQDALGRSAASDRQPHDESFRAFIKNRLPRHKAGADLIQAIKANIRKISPSE